VKGKENKMIQRQPAERATSIPAVDVTTCHFVVGEIQFEIVAQPDPSRASDNGTVYAKFLVEGKCYEVRQCVPQQATTRSPLVDLLTNRERDIVNRIGAGLRNKQIADELNLSEYTVAAYVKQICYKLQVRNRTAVVTRCMQLQASGETGLSASAISKQLQRVMESTFKSTNTGTR
jgi:DNA-binding CsgD family transcriptional regulator